jgi:hypothetical protein
MRASGDGLPSRFLGQESRDIPACYRLQPAIGFAGYALARPYEGNGVIGWVANVIEPA